MPFALVFVGLLCIVVGAKGTQQAFGQQLVKDFTGSGNFVWWLAALGAVGAVGYIPAAKKLSIAFLALILLAMLLSNQGFFSNLQKALQSGPTSPAKSS